MYNRISCHGLTWVSTLACVKYRKLWRTNIVSWFFGSYLLCQVHLQAERASFMVISVGFSSTSSLFTLSTWDHSWRLSAPVNRELPGSTATFTHIFNLAQEHYCELLLWSEWENLHSVYLWGARQDSVPQTSTQIVQFSATGTSPFEKKNKDNILEGQ